MTDECCAHLKVIWSEVKNDDSSLYGKWMCVMCGVEFAPKAFIKQKTINEIKAIINQYKELNS